MSVNAIAPAVPSMWQSLIRNRRSRWRSPSVLGALIVGLVLIAMIGVSLSDAIGAFLDGAFGSAYAIAASINRALCSRPVGLGFIFANRANLTNVGGEGQIAVGGIAATAVALLRPCQPLCRSGSPSSSRCSAAVIAGAAGAASPAC